MRIKSLILTILCFAAFVGQAQVNERFKDKKDKDSQDQQEATVPKPQPSETSDKFTDRLIYGGNLSLNFGSNTFIYLSPTVGYKFTDKIVAGPGFIYQYAKFNRAYNAFTGRFEPFDFESQIYGPKAFFNLIPTDFLYLGTQFEYLNHDVVSSFTTGELTKQWTSVLFLELGYLQKVGAKGMVQFGLKYNVLHDVDSPYNTAFIPSFGFFF